MMRSEYKTKKWQIKKITSLSNPLVKDFRALVFKKIRDRQGLFLAEGLKLIIDALDHGWKIRTLVLSRVGSGNTLVEKTVARTVSAGGLVVETNHKIMAAIAHRDNPQAVVGVFEQRWSEPEKVDFGKKNIFLGLDRIRDPGNLGTIIRTADAVGVSGIILIGNTTTPFSFKTVRATMGSIFTVPLYRMSENQFIYWRKGFQGLVVGSHLNGLVDYRILSCTNKPIILLMGNEQHGLSETLVTICDKLANIPQIGKADSLNIAVATGIMLYELRRKNLLIKRDLRR